MEHTLFDLVGGCVTDQRVTQYANTKVHNSTHHLNLVEDRYMSTVFSCQIFAFLNNVCESLSLTRHIVVLTAYNTMYSTDAETPSILTSMVIAPPFNNRN